jgi:peroxin-12
MELLLLSQFNLDSKLPTFFELVIQERLTDTLRDLFRFLHSTTADRLGGIALRSLPYSTEVFYIMWTFVERLFLNHFDGTFSECCYDMKRVGITPKALQSSSNGVVAVVAGSAAAASGVAAAEGEVPSDTTPSQPLVKPAEASAALVPDSIALDGLGHAVDPTDAYTLRKLSNRQRIMSLLLSTVVPYLRTKLQNYYKALTDPSPDAQLLRETQERNSPWRKGFNTVFLKVWPIVQFIYDSLTLVYWVRYMFDRSPYCCPSFQGMGVALRRLEREDYAKRQNPTGSAARVLGWGFMALNSVVVGMRFLQWWQTNRNANEVATSLSSEALPIPPPPQPTAPHPHYVAEQEVAGRPALEPGKCPVCHNDVANPAVNIASGYVFCFPCLQQQVQARGCCPVSHLPSTVQHIRRLYEV